MSWQPIESAPKATPILLWDRTEGMRVGLYYDSTWCYPTADDLIALDSVILWQPLPEAPSREIFNANG